MAVEGGVAFALAQSYWQQQPPTPIMAGAARFLESLAVARSSEET
jgi:hypothetical protein